MAVKRNKQQRAGHTEEVAWLVKYFASAGSIYSGRPRSLGWLPFCEGKLLRFFWEQARAQVMKTVPERAYEMMCEEFAPNKPSRNFDDWPVHRRRELYELCRETGCDSTFTATGHCVHIAYKDDPRFN